MSDANRSESALRLAPSRMVQAIVFANRFRSPAIRNTSFAPIQDNFRLKCPAGGPVASCRSPSPRDAVSAMSSGALKPR